MKPIKTNQLFRLLVLVALLASFIPDPGIAKALPLSVPPPVDMFQWPWEQGLSWVAFDGFDNGIRRSSNSPHNYKMGGAIDFAPRADIKVGDDTSNYWVTAAAAGTIIKATSCFLYIDHGNGWTTEYWHLANIQVVLGQTVTRNQRLGVIADNIIEPVCTGNEHPGPHLHFVMRPKMIETIFSGWKINFDIKTNVTTFTKNGQTVGRGQPILNVPISGGTPVATNTPTPTGTPVFTSTPTLTASPVTTNTPTLTVTPVTTNTPVFTNTPVASATPSLTNTPISTSTPVFTNTPVPSSTPVSTDTLTPTGIPVFTNTPVSSATPVSTNTPTPTGSPVFTNTPIASDTPVPTNTLISTATPITSATPVATNTLVITATNTLIPTVSTFTPTSTFVFTNTPVATATVITGPYVQTSANPLILVVGDTGLITVSLNNIPVGGYTSTEFTCTYNPALVDVSNIAVAGLFGPDPVSGILGPQNGSFILALAGSNGNRAMGGGTAFTFNATGLQTGQTTVECTARVSNGQSGLQSILSIPTNITIVGFVTPSPAPTVVPTSATLTGQVFASKPVTITLYNPDSSIAATTTANPDGTFSFSAPGGTYTVVAAASGFLSAQGSVTLVNGNTSTKPVVSLIAGDIDGNSVIDQIDALTIGINYNNTIPTAADLNNDGIINVLDLGILAQNYGASGALVW